MGYEDLSLRELKSISEKIFKMEVYNDDTQAGIINRLHDNGYTWDMYLYANPEAAVDLPVGEVKYVPPVSESTLTEEMIVAAERAKIHIDDKMKMHYARKVVHKYPARGEIGKGKKEMKKDLKEVKEDVAEIVEEAAPVEDNVDTDVNPLDDPYVEEVEEPPGDDATFLLVMTRANPTWETHGIKFTQENPFRLVTEEVANAIIDSEDGFRMASPREVREYYS